MNNNDVLDALVRINDVLDAVSEQLANQLFCGGIRVMLGRG